MVNWANREGIVLSYPNGSFRVNEQVGLIFEQCSGQKDTSIPADKNPESLEN